MKCYGRRLVYCRKLLLHRADTHNLRIGNHLLIQVWLLLLHSRRRLLGSFVHHSEVSLIHVSLAHIFRLKDPFHTLLVIAASLSVLSVKKCYVTSFDIFMAPWRILHFYLLLVTSVCSENIWQEKKLRIWSLRPLLDKYSYHWFSYPTNQK